MSMPNVSRAPGWRGKDKGGRISRVKLAVASAFAVLLATAGFVVFLLPAHIAPPRQTDASEPAGVPASSATSERSRPLLQAQADKSEAEQLLTEALRRLTRLESEGVRIWGTEPTANGLPAAEEVLQKARAELDRQRYVASIPLFRDAIVAFDQLSASVPERYRSALDRGRRALAEHDATASTREFEVAIALRPGDPDASSLLARARVLPEVLSNMSKGKDHEATGELDQAQAIYRGAASLDAEFMPARESLNRVDRAIAARDYKAALSEALRHLEKRDFKSATEALQRARMINPKGTEITDVSGRIQAANQSAVLEGVRRNAAALEVQEKWRDAAVAYKKALMVEKDAAFAIRGLARAEAFTALHAAIDVYVAEPDRLHSPEPLAHAKSLATEAEKIGDAGPVLRAKTKRLQDQIVAAENPIPVLLQSDRATDVTIYRVGRMGSFETRQVELRPGKYTAVGSRPGFRDVRVEFQVTAATNAGLIVVRCTEPVR